MLASGAMAQERMRIQYAEAVTIDASTATAQFEAYGRRFSLALTGNDRLLAGVPAARKANFARTRMLRGRVDGREGTWVRLTATGDRVAGAFWDGNDFYIVSRYAEVSRLLVQPLAAAPNQTVVFRLSDALNALPERFCALQSGPAPALKNGLAQYNALVGELKLQFVATPTDQLDISLIADAALAQLYSGAPNDNVEAAMLNALNIVDGIYDAQLGLVITASDMRVAPASPDPFTSNDPEDLLGELSAYRASVPEVRSRAIAHLLTRRSLNDGITLGIATLGGACDVDDGVSLTALGFSGIDAIAPLVMAHEIGHNLGAQHDTATCGDTFLMWPELGPAMQPLFSQCSLDQIRPFIANHRGACVTPPVYGDIETRIGAIANPIRTEAFVWPVFLRSAGTTALADAEVLIDIVGNVIINSAIPTSGSCAPSMGALRCQFGAVPAGAEARVDLNLTAPQMGTLHIRAISDASNDRYENNNLVTAEIDVQPIAILTVGVTPPSRTALVGDTVSYTFNVASSGLRTANDVAVSLGGGAYFQNTSASTSQGVCFVSFSSVTCNLGAIPSGSTAQIVLEGHATQAGSVQVGAQVSSSNAYMAQAGASATLIASARRDLAIDVDGSMRYAVIGSPYDLTFNLRNNASEVLSDGRFRMNTGGVTVQSVTIDGVACASSDYFAMQGGGCPLGTLSAGDVRAVVVRLLFSSATTTNVTLMAELANDELYANNQVSVPVESRSGVDVGIVPSVVNAQIEGTPLVVSADIWSLGTNDAANVRAALEVPVGLRVTSATLAQGSCALDNERRITCQLVALARNASSRMTVIVASDAPAWYTGTFTVAANDDGAPANDTAPVTIVARPQADVGVNAPAVPIGPVVVGRPAEVTYEVFTGSLRPVQAVRVFFPVSSPGLTIESLSAPGFGCTIAASVPYCDLGDLPPSSLVRVTARYSASTGFVGLSGWVRVESTFDSNHGNNFQNILIQTYPAGDAEVRLAGSSVSGNTGNLLLLPRITVNTLARVSGLRLEIAVPSFATVESVSMANGICTGTSTLSCELGEREAGSSDTIDVTLRLNSAGTFSSALSVRAVNDTNGANDTTSLSITANAPAPSNPPPSGGGGGGTFEWLSLGTLLWILRRKLLPRLRAG
jgi:hypothetical protein